MGNKNNAGKGESSNLVTKFMGSFGAGLDDSYDNNQAENDEEGVRSKGLSQFAHQKLRLKVNQF